MLNFGDGTAVKICGVTNLGDALACAEEGVEMIGLNFSPRSLRCLAPDSAAEIVRVVRARFSRTNFVGVFVDQDSAFIERVVANAMLDAVQLHGNETPEITRKMHAPSIIKALRVGPDFSPIVVSEYACDAILLDGWSAAAPGGTGETFPWSIAAALQPQVARLILAGGLTNANVAAAIRVVRPFAVDVCSGVEVKPGHKDREKLRAFVRAVRATRRWNWRHEKTEIAAG